MAAEVESKSIEIIRNAPEFSVFLTPLDFSADFQKHANVATTRVWGKAMHDELDHSTGPFLHAFEQAAKRGIDTRLYLDDLTLSMTDMKFNAAIPFIKDQDEKQWREMRKSMKDAMHTEWKNAGIDVQFLQSDFTVAKLLPFIPFIGVDHTKIVVVDNTVYIGGLNFSGINFDMRDFMVRIQDSEAVDYLSQFFDQKKRGNDVKTTQSGLVIAYDAGEGESIITQTDMEYARRAKKSIHIVSPFPPDGDFLALLKDKHEEGIDVDTVLSSQHEQGNIFSIIKDRAIRRASKSGITLRELDGLTHSKMMIIDGKYVRWGSHNFSEDGVKAHTKELAIYADHDDIVIPLKKYRDELHANSHLLAA